MKHESIQTFPIATVIKYKIDFSEQITNLLILFFQTYPKNESLWLNSAYSKQNFDEKPYSFNVYVI